MGADALVAQCGAPTAVVNASLAAVLRACRADRRIGAVWGVRHGLRGLAGGAFVDLAGVDADRIERQPGALLGGGRDRLPDEELDRIAQALQRRAIGFVFLIGGNGTMAAASALAARAGAVRVVGVPKTIDNDLASTDVAPGYGSAARFVAQSVRDAGLDLYAMRGFDDVAVVEVMGRFGGWLAAAASLARYRSGSPPHVILFPEVPVREDAFLEAVRAAHAREGICVVVAAEGARDDGGCFLAEKEHPAEVDPSGQKLLGISGGPAPHLARLVRGRLGLRARQMRPDVLQRSCAALSSAVDRALARQVGEAAVHAALDGRSGVMIALARRPDGWDARPVPLGDVVGRDNPLPARFLAPSGLDATEAFAAWAAPLVGELAGVVTL